MSERKNIDTSLAAYDSVKADTIPNHHVKILAAFDDVEYATYEQLADKLEMDKHAVGRRLSELSLQGKIYRTGIKLPTSTGRMAYAFSKIGSGIPKADEPEKPKRKVKVEPAPKNKITVREHTWQLKKEETKSLQTPLFEL